MYYRWSLCFDGHFTLFKGDEPSPASTAMATTGEGAVDLIHSNLPLPTVTDEH